MAIKFSFEKFKMLLLLLNPDFYRKVAAAQAEEDKAIDAAMVRPPGVSRGPRITMPPKRPRCAVENPEDDPL